MDNKGYIHIYTGNGKGKTTSALGLCFRAAGCGIKSMFIQFMKGQGSGEIEAARMSGGLITIEQYGSTRLLLDNDPEIFAEHKAEAKKGLERAAEILNSNHYRIIVLDEILNLLHFKIIDEEPILALIDMKPEPVELIITGRGATDKLVRRADLVTEMCEIRHYYSRGVKARRGIEF